eukprot:SAG31_NODE_1969_length_6771_cov_17.211331_3_plen_92_part_00
MNLRPVAQIEELMDEREARRAPEESDGVGGKRVGLYSPNQRRKDSPVDGFHRILVLKSAVRQMLSHSLSRHAGGHASGTKGRDLLVESRVT